MARQRAKQCGDMTVDNTLVSSTITVNGDEAPGVALPPRPGRHGSGRQRIVVPPATGQCSARLTWSTGRLVDLGVRSHELDDRSGHAPGPRNFPGGGRFGQRAPPLGREQRDARVLVLPPLSTRMSRGASRGEVSEFSGTI